MIETRKVLLELIDKSAAEKGCSEEQAKMIRALVSKSMEEELPDVSELRVLLKAIGSS
ncbi:uncharacterized protein METZ01_LOCUS283243 [marine metagenome]|uniref:Uncharacterized protein n=1 Tax=marine metagenome TaxID=408172 RepID=A0A382L1C4_9ZZZZ